MSVRDLVSQPLRPRRAGYFLIGFEDAQRRLGPESRAESQRWGLLPQDATPARQQGTQSRSDGLSRSRSECNAVMGWKISDCVSPHYWGTTVSCLALSL